MYMQACAQCEYTSVHLCFPCPQNIDSHLCVHSQTCTHICKRTHVHRHAHTYINTHSQAQGPAGVYNTAVNRHSHKVSQIHRGVLSSGRTNKISGQECALGWGQVQVQGDPSIARGLCVSDADQSGEEGGGVWAPPGLVSVWKWDVGACGQAHLGVSLLKNGADLSRRSWTWEAGCQGLPSWFSGHWG